MFIVADFNSHISAPIIEFEMWENLVSLLGECFFVVKYNKPRHARCFAPAAGWRSWRQNTNIDVEIKDANTTQIQNANVMQTSHLMHSF